MKHGIILSLLTIVAGLVEINKKCSSESECISASKCPLYQAKLEKIKQLSVNSTNRRSLINDLRSSICNRKLKAVCCRRRNVVGQDPRCGNEQLYGHEVCYGL